MKLLKGNYKCCICKERATAIFVSIKGNIQTNKYCRKHAEEVKRNGAFPTCRIKHLSKRG